jgi:pimeloyl-ACP methyl ester carboxylesterase
MTDNVLKIDLPSGVTVAYTDIGEYREAVHPLVFIHGLGSTHRVWDCNLAVLSPHFRCLALDLPGYGQSPPPRQPITLTFYVQTIHNFLQALGIAEYILVGHSMGGQVILRGLVAGILKPAKVILFAPAGFEQFSEWERQSLLNLNKPSLLLAQTPQQIRRNFAYNFFRLPENAQPLLEKRLLLMRDGKTYLAYLHTIIACVQAMLTEPVYEQLGSIRCPSCIFFGEEDRLIPNRFLHPKDSPASIAHQGASAIPGSKLVIFPQAGHFVQWEKAQEAGSIIRQFAGDADPLQAGSRTQQLIQQFIAAILQHQPQAIDELYANDAVYHNSLIGQLDKAAALRWWSWLCRPEHQLSFDYRITATDEHLCRLVWILELQCHGYLVQLPGESKLSIAAQKIVNHRDNFSPWQLCRQAGGYSRRVAGWLLGWTSWYQQWFWKNLQA